MSFHGDQSFPLKEHKRIQDSLATNLGTRGIKSICDDLDFIKRTEQNHAESTLFRRRKPSDSEITLQDFSAHTAKSIYNKVRALQDPYPNAYIVCGDGTKLFIKDAYYE